MRLTNTLGLAIALIIIRNGHSVSRHYADSSRPAHIRFYDPVTHAFTQRPTP